MPKSEPVAEVVMRLQEILDRYETEWILVKILDPVGPRGDSPSVALAHDLDRKKMSRELKKAWKREPNALLGIMHGGGKFGDGEALRRSLARIAAEEEFVSVNPW
jgi:hypothetical protein